MSNTFRTGSAVRPFVQVINGADSFGRGLSSTAVIAAREDTRPPVLSIIFVSAGGAQPAKRGRGRLAVGFVEVSSDGGDWVRAGQVRRRTGTAAFDAEDIRFLRVLPNRLARRC